MAAGEAGLDGLVRASRRCARLPAELQEYVGLITLMDSYFDAEPS